MTIANNKILPSATTTFASGITMQNVGPKQDGNLPVVSVTKNLITGITTPANRLRLTYSNLGGLSASTPFFVDASLNAYFDSGAATANLGPSSSTVTSYLVYDGLAAAVGLDTNDTAVPADRLKTWPWLTTYTNAAASTGFDPAAGYGSASGDPHFTGFDVSCGARPAGGAEIEGDGGVARPRSTVVLTTPQTHTTTLPTLRARRSSSTATRARRSRCSRSATTRSTPSLAASAPSTAPTRRSG